MVEENINKFKNRYEYYRERIENVTYPEEEFLKLTPNNYDVDLSKEESTKKVRLKMLEQKYHHTLRVVSILKKLNQQLIHSKELQDLSLISGLLHDYGRFIQAVYYNSYQDAEIFYRNHNYNGHGEVGAKLLFELGDIRYFDIDEKYYDILYDVIKYHQVPNLPNNLNMKIKNENDINNNRYMLTSFLLQLVKDADMYDILYQRINGEYPIFSDTFKIHVNDMTIDDISVQTGIDIDTIMKWNNLTDKAISSIKKLKLPFDRIDPKLLEVPDKIKHQFFSKIYLSDNEAWDFNKMLNDNTFNYNSITAMWWTIGQFLSKFNFTATLNIIRQDRLLERIYSMYPEKYKYLVKDMFEFAIKELLDKRISEGKVYAKVL